MNSTVFVVPAADALHSRCTHCDSRIGSDQLWAHAFQGDVILMTAMTDRSDQSPDNRHMKSFAAYAVRLDSTKDHC
jgi:hypothetical protein